MTATSQENLLGAFLRDRRAKLDPVAFGFMAGRRRTPGLRREEVAQRANVSATWYTWLEQGRGGAPSAEVLDRLSRALVLTAAEREHLFLLAQSRPPEVSYSPSGGVTPQLQRVLDAMPYTPALIRTSTWEVVAWNRAAAVVLTDYGQLPPGGRNILRLMFCIPAVRARMADWQEHARRTVSTFRLETARAGAGEQVKDLVAELLEASPDFAAIWRENDVSSSTEGFKKLHHPVAGPLSFEYAAFEVAAQPGLTMMVHTPVTDGDRERVRALIDG